MLISLHSSKYFSRPSDLGVLLSFPVDVASGRIFYLKTKQNMCACTCVRADTCWQEQGGKRTGLGVHTHLLPYLRHGLSSVVHCCTCQDSWPASKGFSYSEGGILHFWIGFWTKNVLSFATEDISEASGETWIRPAALVTEGTHIQWGAPSQNIPIRHKLYPNTYFHREILY